MIHNKIDSSGFREIPEWYGTRPRGSLKPILSLLGYITKKTQEMEKQHQTPDIADINEWTEQYKVYRQQQILNLHPSSK